MNKDNLNDCPDFLQDFLFYMETIKGKSSKTVDEYFSNFVKEFPKFTYMNRVKALEDYMNQFLYPLWEKYTEF